MQQYNAHACTDITGFGLLGHGFEMAQGNGVRLEFFADRIPVFDGATQLVKKKTFTRAYAANTKFLDGVVSFEAGVSEEMRHVLLEAETSGGLLFAMPESEAAEAVTELHGRDCSEAAVVGRVAESSGAEIRVFA